MVHKGWRVKVRCARVCVRAGVWSPWQDAANEKNSKAAGKVNLKKHARRTNIWIHWCVRVCVRFHFISFFCYCCSARIPFAGSYKTFPTFTLISTVESTWAHMMCLSLFPLSRSLSLPMSRDSSGTMRIIRSCWKLFSVCTIIVILCLEPISRFSRLLFVTNCWKLFDSWLLIQLETVYSHIWCLQIRSRYLVDTYICSPLFDYK